MLTQIAITSFGQPIWEINFDDTTFQNRVVIDTIINPNNIWQIGQPNKTVFTNANSNPNVILTDTIHYFPTNDTSSFTIIHIACDGWLIQYPKVDIGGWYYVNSDTLTDYGYIDFSADQGNTWYRADSSLGFCTWGAIEELPVFTGNSNGWKHFYYCLQTPFQVNMGDTILYRFTFITDSLQTNKDGIMFDDLHFEDWSEGIAEIEIENLISIYPNPVNDKLHIEINQGSKLGRVQIINTQGLLLYDNRNLTENYIDVSQLKNGIYILKYFDKEFYSIKRFTVIN